MFESEFGHSIHYAFTIGNITNIQNKYEGDAVNIFPNPTSGLFTLDMVRVNGLIVIEIYGAAGSLISSKQYNTSGMYNSKIDLTKHANGLYILKITTNEKTILKKVLKN